MELKEHWEQVYTTKAPDTVSWYQEHATRSLQLVEATGVPHSAAIIDVGGGASNLAGDLLARGYKHVTVLDVSAAALATAQAQLRDLASEVMWLESDVTTALLKAGAYDIWHDRAVFHFLTNSEDRQHYKQTLLHSVRPGGHVIIATFAEDGPEKCSGLPVMRYSASALAAELGEQFSLVSRERESHVTPSGVIQQFMYCYFRVRPFIS